MNYAELLNRPIAQFDICKEALTCEGAFRMARWDPICLITDQTGLPPLVPQMRRPMKLDRVLVTGACGSIGSKIVEKLTGIAGRIYAADRNERALAEMPETKGVIPCLLDVTHRQRVAEYVHRWQPNLIVHAAAYKHVPLMEHYPDEAYENNRDGTKHVVDAARVAAPDARVVFISTDKAATCATVMGRTKRAAEDYIHSMQSAFKRPIVVVRFGNVLGSSGSVIEIWERQLAVGEPLTVAADASRYFCTIDEAAELAIYGSAFVWSDDECNATPTLTLGMGDPIKMQDLARRFLKFKGVEEYELELIGLRPGDQQTEVLAGIGEELREVEVADV